jgi:hypothetical protein
VDSRNLSPDELSDMFNDTISSHAVVNSVEDIARYCYFIGAAVIRVQMGTAKTVMCHPSSSSAFRG